MKRFVSAGLTMLLGVALVAAMAGPGAAAGGPQAVTFEGSGYSCPAYFLKTASGIVHEWRLGGGTCPAVYGEAAVHLVFKPYSKFSDPSIGPQGLLGSTFDWWFHQADYTSGGAALAGFFMEGEKYLVGVYRVSDEVRSSPTLPVTSVAYTAGGLARTATFQVYSGSPPRPAGGTFHYTDAASNWYDVTVTAVMISGSTAYFSGPVTAASNSAWLGLYLTAKVMDGTPDQIWGSFAATDPASSLGTVDPADGPFEITGGNLTVYVGS